ncbi:MAG: hypothetical protein HC890_07740 [Chloroflexaceae bacterium]|nr:hypothetical protein [Chloroflexaceae bacterium]
MTAQSIRTHLSASLGYLFSVIFVVPAAAATQKLGVVYSSDNANHWPQIAERLRATGIDYCVVTASRWQQIGDLQNLSVLFLPNVSTLSREQAQSLEAWMKRGGNVVVSGPTGNLSQPEVRSQLRSLFGAYWGFPITSATPLKPDTGQGWTNQPNLAATFRGGVVLPATLQSRTAAVWLSEGKPPAVVTTEKATFLGWRWGVDGVVGSVVDLAWLQASLKRYGPLPTGFRETPLTCDTQTPLTVADTQDERNQAEVPTPPPLLARGSNLPTLDRQPSAPAVPVPSTPAIATNRPLPPPGFLQPQPRQLLRSSPLLPPPHQRQRFYQTIPPRFHPL